MSTPELRVELRAQPIGPRFGNPLVLDSATEGQLDQENLSGPDEWVDLSARVRSVDVSRGNRNRDLDAFRAGTATVVFDNRDRELDPTNDGADLAGNIVPNRKLRISGRAPGFGWEVLFEGKVEGWSIDWIGPNDSTATCTVIDAMAVLANQVAPSVDPEGTGELPNARFNRVLDAVGWDPALRSLDAGVVTLFDYIGGQNVAEYLHEVATSEGGSYFVSRDGKVTFRDRSTPPNEVAAVDFADASGGAGQVGYARATLRTDSELLFNRVTVTPPALSVADEQQVEDAFSIAQYEVRDLERLTLADNTSDVLDLAQYLLARFKDPEVRFGSVDVQLQGKLPARQNQLLRLDLADLVTVVRNPPGGGVPPLVDQAGRVDSMRWSMRPGNQWDLTVNLSASQRFGFILDDDDNGVLDSDTLG